MDISPFSSTYDFHIKTSIYNHSQGFFPPDRFDYLRVPLDVVTRILTRLDLWGPNPDLHDPRSCRVREYPNVNAKSGHVNTSQLILS